MFAGAHSCAFRNWIRGLVMMGAKRNNVAIALLLAAGILGVQAVTSAQQPVPPSTLQAAVTSAPVATVPAIAPATDYVIGPTDVLSILYWGDKEMSSEVTVRPDGKITLPLLNDVVAAGQTPEQLRRTLTASSKRFMRDEPEITVVVKQVNNNRAFVTGQVARPGPYVLTGQTTVLQVLAMAGGFTEFADRKRILITRVENGEARFITFNYEEMLKHPDPKLNIVLRAGDTIVVP